MKSQELNVQIELMDKKLNLKISVANRRNRDSFNNLLLLIPLSTQPDGNLNFFLISLASIIFLRMAVKVLGNERLKRFMKFVVRESFRHWSSKLKLKLET